MARCRGTTKSGMPCKLPALPGEKYCRFHTSQEKADHEGSGVISETEGLLRFGRQTLVSFPHQAIPVVITFLITWAFSRHGQFISSVIIIPDSAASTFLAGMAQALASLLALLIAFSLFQMEGIDRERDRAYEVFKAEIRELTRLATNRPINLAQLDEPLAALISNIAYLNLNDFPLLEETRKELIYNLTQTLVDTVQDKYSNITVSNRLYFEQIIITLKNVEDSFNRLGIVYIRVIVTPLIFGTIAKLAFLLGLSLVLLLLFGVIYIPGNFPDLTTPTLFSLIVWLAIVLCEAVYILRRDYRDLAGEWSSPIR